MAASFADQTRAPEWQHRELLQIAAADWCEPLGIELYFEFGVWFELEVVADINTVDTVAEFVALVVVDVAYIEHVVAD